MNNYFTFSHSKELTAQCTELRRYNVWLRVCWFTGRRDWTFNVAKRSATWTMYFTAILRNITFIF